MKKASPLSLLASARVKPYAPKKGEPYMSDAQLEHFKVILEAWKKQILADSDNTQNKMQDQSERFADPSDRATQEEEFSLELRTRDRERKLLKKIENTLNKINLSDGFGYCDSCGEEIGIKRLETRPTADLCIDCKTLAEIREKHMA